MAGIGFELKKLFQKKGVFATLRAFGYATVITTGPMFLGIVLILGIMLLCMLARTPETERELLICMITYTLLASVIVNSVLSMVVTRFTSDMIFEERNEEVLPSFWGSSFLMMLFGGILWLVFLIFSGATFVQGILLYILFEELILVWNSMSYLTALKDYKTIFLSFLVAIAAALLLGFLLISLKCPVIESMLLSVTVGYGIKLVFDFVVLYRYFPDRTGRPFTFMRWMDKYKTLPWIGLFTSIGVYSHLIVMWFSEIGVQLRGLFYSAPFHDVPALLAFLTILVTTVNFVVSVEVNFYPKYRNYSSLYSDKGTAEDIEQAEHEMLGVLRTEAFYTALKQLVCTALAIAIGSYLLDLLPLGFNEIMKGYFRTLCVGYGLYAIGNMLMLLLLYFVDYRGAFVGTALFAGCSTLFSVLSLFFPSVYYGFGFIIGSLVFVLFSVFRLADYTKRLPYYILCEQPLIAEEINGIHTKAANALDKCFREEEKK